MNVREYISEMGAACKKELIENIMPFWLIHGWDHEHGGVYTCLDRDGSLMDSTKSVWFQGRFAFVCAFAYNYVEKRTEWLEASKSAIDFIEKYCFDGDGHMYFSVKADGTPVRKRRYVFSETFAAIAMSEYSIASGERSYALKALKVFQDTLRFLATPGYLSAKYEPSIQLQSHSIVMILINVGSCLRRAIDDPAITEQINRSIDILQRYFMKPEYHALLELVGPQGEFINTNMTRTINPGHCFETSWFLFEEARQRGWDKHLTDMALTIFNWSWDWGWDKEYGGIINFRDCLNMPCQDYSQDMKFWWPQCESLIASLYAYLATSDEEYLKRHRQIHDWTYAHFADDEYGEWFGYLHRDGTVAQHAKGNIFKGPFHIPRMLVKCYLLCNDILARCDKEKRELEHVAMNL